MNIIPHAYPVRKHKAKIKVKPFFGIQSVKLLKSRGVGRG
jgi:hypothetical protein